ncbi:ABC transporter ATP-binding protein [Kitasatospora herbaricolor]|uniref:ABC transporter ATP-binding protein n=1 Tax=Kitasatospora herbaricolor TaxID=68217 RepID=UPI00174884FD|nr:ATP-binding cassette domain-containing protein [Kitasatospora herbaricolor]MDQ0306459.1 iron complex transport system ATP-binding protein [Kitasatospora herbaricolor]GGV45997.1 ABC transporter ATP-binding protein [Kitasatospora herbaricolor]
MSLSASPLSDGPLLRTREVDVVRDGRYLLRGISLTVEPGEHWALLGANGAGKSTLLALLGAVSHPTRGEVDVLGRRLGRVDIRDLRAYLGHVNPRHPLRSPLTVREVVLTGLGNSIEPDLQKSPTAAEQARADQVMDTLGIAAMAEATWPTLSQGERGRTLIARALMPSPRLLLLDEPATGLDLTAREQLLDSLDLLRHQHPELASVLVTHHLEELPESTTHALLLRDGECVAAGKVDEVITTELISDCFAHPIRITRHDGRWTARAAARRVGRAPGA